MAQADLSALILAEGPSAWYKLDDASGNPVDSSGNGAHMDSITGAPSYQQGAPFPGGQSVLIHNADRFTRSTQVTTLTDNVTIELWVNVVTQVGDAYVYNGNGGGNGYGLMGGSAGTTVRALLGGVNFLSDSNGIVPTYAWSMINLVRRATVWEYWINGRKDSSSPGSTSPNLPSGVTFLGPGGGGGSEYYASNLVIYPSAQSGDDILARYNAALYGPPTGTRTQPRRMRSRGTSW